jgi:hypothetical protein
MVLVSPRTWPETTETAPNSPIARALHNSTVEQRPFHVRQGHLEEGAQAGRAERERGLLVQGSLLAHERDQLAGNERKGARRPVASTMPGSANMIVMSCACSQGPR